MHVSTQVSHSKQVPTCLPLPPIHVLEEFFEYLPESGQLLFVKSARKGFVGKEAGWINAQGYRQIRFQGRTYFAHRIIWTLVHGDIPADKFIDHIDGNPSNNALANLRLVSLSANSRNSKLDRRNSTGVPGIDVRTTKNGEARFCVRAAGSHWGTYSSLAEAAERRAYIDLALGFHPNHGRQGGDV